MLITATNHSFHNSVPDLGSDGKNQVRFPNIVFDQKCLIV